MLNPELRTPAARAALRARWAGDACLRIDDLLDPGAALALWRELREQPFRLRAQAPPVGLAFQYFEYQLTPEADCDHVLCRAGRWWMTELREWLGELTGLDLAVPPGGALISHLYTRGSYLAAHNDHDGSRALAFVYGLTRDRWPVEVGGHLEFLIASAETVTIGERRAPGWNTLDVFDVRAPTRLHRVPMVTAPVERRTITGWFHDPPPHPDAARPE